MREAGVTAAAEALKSRYQDMHVVLQKVPRGNDARARTSPRPTTRCCCRRRRVDPTGQRACCVQIRQHDLEPALLWAQQHRQQLSSPDGGPSSFEFRLQALKFLNLLSEQGERREGGAREEGEEGGGAGARDGRMCVGGPEGGGGLLGRSPR